MNSQVLDVPGSERINGERINGLKLTYLERQVSYFLGNCTPKTGNYCLKNRALDFPGPVPINGIS